MSNPPETLRKQMKEAKTSMEEIVSTLSAVKGEYHALAVRDLFSLLNGVEWLLTVYAVSCGTMDDSQKEHFEFMQKKLISICYEQLLYVASAISLTECVIATKNEPFQRAVTEMMPAMANKKTEEIKKDIDTLMLKMSQYKGMFIL